MADNIKQDDGEELAKVLWYYNMIDGTSTLSHKIVCPFHSDLRPSMQVDLDKGYYYCHGCGATGNALDFIKGMEPKLGDLQRLLKKYEILKSEKCSNINVNHSLAKIKFPKKLYNEAYDYYHGLKKVDWCVKSDETEIEEAKAYLIGRGFTPEALNICGAKITYNRSYGVIFPIMDNGKFRGWVCRTMIKRIEQERKYLYNDGFSRLTTVVGNYGSKKYVFIVEGYMDKLKFIQFGEQNVVAIFGWKITRNQVEKLKKSGVTDVISALDNDDCGKKGTEYLKEFFNVTRFKYLRGVKDPGEMTKEIFNKCHKKTMSIYNGGK